MAVVGGTHYKLVRTYSKVCKVRGQLPYRRYSVTLTRALSRRSTPIVTLFAQGQIRILKGSFSFSPPNGICFPRRNLCGMINTFCRHVFPPFVL